MRVSIPLIRPGIAAAGVLVFAFVLSDQSTPRALLPLGMATLSTKFYDYASTSVSFGAAAPYAAVLMVVAALSTYLLMTRFGRTRLGSA